jgi:hypothetical protein
MTKEPPHTCGFIDTAQDRIARMMIEHEIKEGHPLFDTLIESLIDWDIIRANVTAVRAWGHQQAIIQQNA